MIVTCPQCTARYKLDQNKISARGAKITCPRCRHVFVVYREEGRDDVTNTPLDSVIPDQAPPPSRQDASTLDFRKVGISSWKVRVKIGLVYDFSDIKTLRKYIQDGRVTADDVISHDGATWVTIGDIPDLDAYFIQVYERCQAERESEEAPGPNEFEEDDDTNVIGMGSLGGKLAEQALAQATAEAEAELKAARSSKPKKARPAPPSAQGPQFVDPFAALKDKQRERIQQRRRGGKPVETKEAPPSGSMVPKLAVAALLLALVGGGAWWWTSQQSNAATDGFNKTGAPIQPPPKQVEKDPVQDLNNEIDNMLKELDDERKEDEKDDEPPQLIPIGPDNPNGLRPVGPTNTPPTPQVDNRDYDKECLEAGARADWTAALAACASANQGDVNIGYYYGLALHKKGQNDRALGVLMGMTGVKCDANLHVGRILKSQGDIPGAMGAFQKYKGCNPADAGTADREMQALTGG